jgi:hypothetical protein
VRLFFLSILVGLAPYNFVRNSVGLVVNTDNNMILHCVHDTISVDYDWGW